MGCVVYTTAYMEKSRENLYSRKETKSGSYEKLKEGLKHLAHAVNTELSEAHGIKNFLDDTGAIRIEEFAQSNSFSPEKIKKDIDAVHGAERNFSGADDQNVQLFYKEQYSIDTPEGIIQKHQEHKERSKSGQMEMVTAVLFFKAFKEDFFVARASAYDDYMNGIDTVLINKKTGEIVCALDEVHNHIQSKRKDEKLEKIRKIARKGGTTFRYGIAMEKGVFVRKSTKYLPVFCIHLGTHELDAMLAHVSTATEPLSDQERELCKIFVSSMQEQSKEFLVDITSRDVIENNKRAQQALGVMHNLLHDERK